MPGIHPFLRGESKGFLRGERDVSPVPFVYIGNVIGIIVILILRAIPKATYCEN